MTPPVAVEWKRYIGPHLANFLQALDVLLMTIPRNDFYPEILRLYSQLHSRRHKL